MYQNHVERALQYILRHADKSGLLVAREHSSHGLMYEHGFATWFLAAAAAGDGGEKLTAALSKAAALTVSAQNPQGGWRYLPKPNDADVTVTAVQVVALAEARRAGVRVPQSTFDRAAAYIKKCQTEDGGFRYMTTTAGPSAVPRSAAAAAALHECGGNSGPAVQRALKYLLQHRAEDEGVLDRHFYYFAHLFAMRAMRAAGDVDQKSWSAAARADLLRRQQPEGIWDEPKYGVEYSTAIACLTLLEAGHIGTGDDGGTAKQEDGADSTAKADAGERPKAASFRLPADAIEQSRRFAAREASTTQASRTARRPAGLEDLESMVAVERAVQQAMADLGKLAQREPRWRSDPRTRLRYLGDRAFDALVAGIRGDNRSVALQSCHLLAAHGARAVPSLVDVLRKHADEHVRAAAGSALGQTFHPDAFQPLIDALDDESGVVCVEACRALGYFRDERAIAPLSKHVGDPNGHIASNSIQQIRGPLSLGPAYWPTALLNIRQLTDDAATLMGESFGQTEIEVLAEHLRSKYWDVRVQCLHALAALKATQSIPQIVAAPRCSSRAYVLAQLATPAAFDALLEDLGSTDKSVKQTALSGIASGGGRWAAPLLIAMLDDESLQYAARKETSGLGADVVWPAWHSAHTALMQHLNQHGIPGEMRNLYQGETNDVAAETVRLRQWWRQHGADFVAGKDVPNPNLTQVMYIDP